jgi:hypothetical protein
MAKLGKFPFLKLGAAMILNATPVIFIAHERSIRDGLPGRRLLPSSLSKLYTPFAPVGSHLREICVHRPMMVAHILSCARS